MLDPWPRDPLGVRAGAQFVVSRAELVSIDMEAIRAFCHELAERGPQEVPPWDPRYHYSGNRESTIAYLFVLDSLNFCFWSDPKWQITIDGTRLDGYWALAAALTREVTAHPRFLDAAGLATVDTAVLGRVLEGQTPIPLLTERAANLRELGRWIAADFEGEFAAVLRVAEHDAIALVRLVVSALTSFRDVASYAGQPVPFYKRAQILAADLQGVFTYRGWEPLNGMTDLTAFADYKVPQILRRQGIIRYAPALAQRVDNQIQLPVDSPEEVEIRAATIWAIELIRQELANLDLGLHSYQIDWLLWLASQKSGALLPYHRTRTIYY